MYANLYKLIFSRDSFDLNDDYERLSEYEKEMISSMSVDTFFDFDHKDGNYICFFLTDSESINSYISILKNNLIDHKLIDLSKSVIEGKIDMEDEIKSSINSTSQIKFNIFIDDIDNWILQNLNIDIVLDRITEVGGIDNLKQIEKEFLKKYK